MIERGQIYWCSLDPVQGHESVEGHEKGALRPVVIVSADLNNASKSPLTAIVPLDFAF